MGPAPMMATSVVSGWVMVMMGPRLACRLANLWAGVYGWLMLPQLGQQGVGLRPGRGAATGWRAKRGLAESLFAVGDSLEESWPGGIIEGGAGKAK